LDAIIAVGYRVNSYQRTQFRIWATSALKECNIKGYAIDDERVKQGIHLGKEYLDDLMERIREIRTSERRYYAKDNRHLCRMQCRIRFEVGAYQIVLQDGAKYDARGCNLSYRSRNSI
jgi:Virulence protein